MRAWYKFNVWQKFLTTFCISLALAATMVTGFIIAMDPYGIRVGANDIPRPIVDINQRFMYPQLARSNLYNSAVFGTSSLRLIDPHELNALFSNQLGGPVHFANLAMNAATPWEQMQLAQLFLKAHPAPQVLILGIDRSWCDQSIDTTEKRLTFRAFPEHFYDDQRWNDWLDVLNIKSLEISLRLVFYHLGLRDVSLREDGYGVFVPPEEVYDLTRARRHIWADYISQGRQPEVVPQNPPFKPAMQDQEAWKFPAASWIGDLLQQLPSSTNVYLLFPPMHISAQPQPGSMDSAMDKACKHQFITIGERNNATVMDFRKDSSITREDANFWDPLHYRLPFASRIARALVKPNDKDDFYEIISRRATSLPLSAQ